jgi:hypothetical protein
MKIINEIIDGMGIVATQLRDNGHWQREDFTQRITQKEWREILIRGEDSIIVNGRYRQLKAKSLGAGVYEIYKAPLKD